MPALMKILTGHLVLVVFTDFFMLIPPPSVKQAIANQIAVFEHSVKLWLKAYNTWLAILR